MLFPGVWTDMLLFPRVQMDMMLFPRVQMDVTIFPRVQMDMILFPRVQTDITLFPILPIYGITDNNYPNHLLDEAEMTESCSCFCAYLCLDMCS